MSCILILLQTQMNMVYVLCHKHGVFCLQTGCNQPWRLSNLCRFSMDFMEEFGWSIVNQYTTCLIKMLSHCQELEDLHLCPWHPTYLHMTQIFGLGHWPSLKRFTLQRMGNINLQYDAINSFIRAHPKIEQLFINMDDYEAPDSKHVWTMSLPNLKALHLGKNWDMMGILNASTTRNLKFLLIINLSSDSQEEHLRILVQIPTLCSLVVYCPSPSPELLGKLTHAVPWIERLLFCCGTYQSRLTAQLIETDHHGVSPLTSLMQCHITKVHTI
jgi:hypothetical protein